MGFSTLDGVPMGTRCGALDAGVLLHLLQHHHLSVAQLEQMLYLESGLLGLSGGESADMRALLASPSQEAAEAVEIFVRRCAREVAALATAAGGLQGLVFTAGIGEHASAIRARIVAQLTWLGVTLDEAANAVHAAVISAPGSKVEVRVVPTNEELSIAQGVTALLPG
jgi:acetate kinase